MVEVDDDRILNEATPPSILGINCIELTCGQNSAMSIVPFLGNAAGPIVSTLEGLCLEISTMG